MAKKQATAIDIGADSIKVARLEQTSSGIKIVNIGIGRYPRGEDVEVSDDIIIKTLRDVFLQIKIRSKSVAFSSPRSLASAKRLSFQTPSITDAELADMVELQAEVEIPFEASNAIYNHHNIQRTQDSVSAELVAVRKNDIERYMNIFREAGILPTMILPSTYATSVLALNQLADSETDHTTMVVDIGARRTDLCILRGDRMAFSRSFPLGGDQLTQAYAGELSLSFQDAEERKISSASLEGETPEPLVLQWAARLSEELQRSIQAFSRDMLGVEQIGNIWLCGASATIPGLVQYIADRLTIPASLWNPFSVFEVDASVELPEDLRYCFAVSLGLGTNVFTEHVGINLLPIEERQRKERAKQRIFTISYAAAAVMLIAGLAWGVINWKNTRNVQLESVSEKLADVRKDSERASTILIDELVMAKILSPRLSPLDILKELSEQFPDRTKVAFTNFSLDRTQKITLMVEANSQADLSELISKLDKSDLFEDVKSGVWSPREKGEKKEKRQIVQAQITCKLAKNADNQKKKKLTEQSSAMASAK